MRLPLWLLVRFVIYSSLGLVAALRGGPIHDGSTPEDLAAVRLPEAPPVAAVDGTVHSSGDDGPSDSSHSSPRHAEEKRRLLRRMDKSSGSWDTNHPRARLLDALFAYSRYGERTTADLNRWRELYQHVARKQQHVLESSVGYTQKLDTVGRLIEVNAQLCRRVVATALEYYAIEPSELEAHIRASEKAGKVPDRTSVSHALKHYVRDWSEEGQSERDNAFPCIQAILQELFPDRTGQDVKVLLPGAGLGRLGHEIAELGGFEVTNNEWSMYMNMAYRFLEAHPQPGSSAVHPFVDGWSHHATAANMFRSVSFPDRIVNSGAVLLVEGDFTTIFGTGNGSLRSAKKTAPTYDVIVTHFFIDTARNLMAYLDTIYALLRQGGYWVNFGPLLYGTGPWVQLSLDEIVCVIKTMGFEFVPVPDACGELTIEGELVRGRTAVYGFDQRALTRNAYAAQTWAVKKVEP